MSVNQPAYLPWLGYFQRIAVSDVHVVLDHVQFEKNSFVNRNQVLCGGQPTWLTVPVRTKGKFGDLPIADLEIDTSQDWRTKHWRTLSQHYRKAPYFNRYEPFFSDVYTRQWTHLAHLCEHITAYCLKQLGIATPLLFSRDMHLQRHKSELVLEVCTKLHADTYLSGALGRNYLAVEQFSRAGVKVCYQDYRHPVYPQLGKVFHSHMAVVDLLFNCGDASLAIMTERQEISV